MSNQLTEIPTKKTLTALADQMIHNPYVDVAVGIAVGTAIVLSRGRLAGVAESLFPKASSLLGESTQVGEASAGLQAEMRAQNVMHDLPPLRITGGGDLDAANQVLNARPALLTFPDSPQLGGTSESVLKDHLVELLRKAESEK